MYCGFVSLYFFLNKDNNFSNPFSGLVPKNSIKGICLAEFSKTDKTLSFKEGSPNVMSYSCLATASLKCNTLDAFKRLATFLVP